MTLSQPPDPERSLAAKFGRLKLKDPISLALVLIVGILALFLLFPSDKQGSGADQQAFEQRLADRRQRDDRAAQQALDQFQKRLRDQGLVLQDQEAYRALKEQNEALLAQNSALRQQPNVAGDRRAWHPPTDKVLTESFYAPLQKRVWTPEPKPQNAIRSSVKPKMRAEAHQPTKPRPVTSPLLNPHHNNGPSLQPGTWIPAILDHRVHGHLAQHAKATVREDVIDAGGRFVLIPKGSKALLKVVRGQDSGTSHTRMTLVRLIRPDGQTIDLPLPIHDTAGEGALEPDRINRHFWQKLGLATLVAVSSAAPYALFDDGDNTAFQLAVGETTVSRLASLIERLTAIPDEIILEGGHPIHILVTEAIQLPPARLVFSDQPTSAEMLRPRQRMNQVQAFFEGRDLAREVRP